MQIRKQDMARLDHGDFGRLRFLDLDDHVASREHIGCCMCDVRTDCHVIGIGKIDPHAGLRFDDDLVSGGRQFRHRRRRQADAIFMIFDLFGNTDAH